MRVGEEKREGEETDTRAQGASDRKEERERRTSWWARLTVWADRGWGAEVASC